MAAQALSDIRDEAATPGPRAPRLAHSLGWNVVADACARGASLWLAFFCARTLRVADFGRFTFGLALAQWLWLLGDAALNGGYAARQLAREPGDAARLAGAFHVWRLGAACVLTAAVLLALPVLPLPAGARPTVAAGTLFFLAYAAFPDWLFRGHGDFRGLAAGNAAYALVLVALSAVVLPRRPDPAFAVAIWGGAFVAGSVLLTVMALRAGRFAFAPVGPLAWWPHLRRSIVFAAGSLFAIGCVQAPAILVGELAGARETGLFAAGFRLVFAFIGLFSVLWWPLMPALTRLSPAAPEFRALFVRVLRGGLLVALSAAIACTLFPRPILALLFGTDYAPGARALAIGAWALPAYAVSGLLEQASLALGRERRRLAVQAGAFALLVASALVAVPRLGATGAALAVTTTFVLMAFTFGIAMRRDVPLGAALRAARTELATCGALALAWSALVRLTPLPWWLVLPLGTLAVAPAVWTWGPFRTRASRPAALRTAAAAWAPLPPLPAEPLVTVVLAVRNEAACIGAALDAVRAQDWPALEILVVDGASDDGTLETVRAVAARDPRVRLLANPRRCVAPGLNLGLAAARGDVLVRVDGHCSVPADYVSTCVRHLRAQAAECVGGPVRAAGSTVAARAIAYAMSTPFGVGGAAFRWARDTRQVDHLPFGAWHRGVFARLGGFDERLVRNQDDEFSDRLRRAGGRILLDPAIPVTYWSRRDLGALWRQYAGYGYWKVRVIRMRGGWPRSPRHLVPAAFVVSAVGSIVAAAVTGAWALPALVFGAYAAVLAVATVCVGFERRDRAVLALPAALATLHTAYGVGFLGALLRALVERA